MDNIFVLYGSNKFLIDYNLKNIVGDNDIELYDMEEITVHDALGYARELPMFDDIKYVVLDNCNFFSSSKCKLDHNIDELVSYLENPVRTSVVVFIVRNEKLDNRKKIVSLLDKKYKVIECNEMLDVDIFNYAKSLFKNNNKTVTDEVIRHLIIRINNNVDVLKCEVDKLCLYDDVIDCSLVDELVTEYIDDNIFSFIDSIVNNDKKKMFSIYEEILKKTLEPIQIIVMLSQEFRTIYQVRSLMKMGYSDKDIMNILDIYKIGRIKFVKSKARGISDDRLILELCKLADLDILIKTGEVDKYIAFEQYLLNL